MTITASSKLGLDVSQKELKATLEHLRRAGTDQGVLGPIERALQALSDSAWVMNYLVDLAWKLQVVGGEVDVTPGPATADRKAEEQARITEAVAQIAANAVRHAVVDPMIRSVDDGRRAIRHVELFVIAGGPPPRPTNPEQLRLLAKVMEPPEKEKPSGIILPSASKIN